MNKKYRIMVLIILIIIIGIIVGIFLLNNTNKKMNQNYSKQQLANNIKIEENINKNGETLITSNIEDKISPNCMLIFKTYYSNCGHTQEKRVKINQSLVNGIQSDLQEYYKDWTIEKFSNNEVILYKKCNEFCNEHYLIKENNGYVAIYKIDLYGNEVLEEQTQIITDYLTKNDREILKNGIKVIGKDRLNATIEDYE